MRARLTVAIGPQDVGRRISVRHRLEHPEQGRALTDVVGYLRAWREDGWLQIERRSGELVWVAETALVAARIVPGPAPRRAPGPDR